MRTQLGLMKAMEKLLNTPIDELHAAFDAKITDSGMYVRCGCMCARVQRYLCFRWCMEEVDFRAPHSLAGWVCRCMCAPVCVCMCLRTLGKTHTYARSQKFSNDIDDMVTDLCLLRLISLSFFSFFFFFFI